MLQELINAGIPKELANRIINGEQGFWGGEKTEVRMLANGQSSVMLEEKLAKAITAFWASEDGPKDDKDNLFVDFSQDYQDSLDREEWYQ